MRFAAQGRRHIGCRTASLVVTLLLLSVAAHHGPSPLAEAVEPCAIGQRLEQAVERYGQREVRQLERALQQPADVDRLATELRRTAGVAAATEVLPSSRVMLRGTAQNAGLVPRSVGETIRGRMFNTFDEFRGAFWKTVADSPYAAEFDDGNRALMRAGRAPTAPETQWVGGRVKYELHHIQPIQHGGSVYDMSNIMIATPRFHQDV
jgi:hypothetical protein